MQNNQYFDWGSPGTDQKHQIGLWEPVLDRFLLVGIDPQITDNIRMIASSRYLLFACDLATATNYAPNLIDNSCCENWTLVNKKSIEPNKFINCVGPIKVKELTQCHRQADWNTELEKSWLMFVYYWLKFLRYLKGNSPWYSYDRFIKNFIDNSFGEINDYYDHLENTEKFILKSLYLGKDIDTVHKEITDFLKSIDPSIHRHWIEWSQNKS
jgi:hypothetical protein